MLKTIILAFFMILSFETKADEYLDLNVNITECPRYDRFIDISSEVTSKVLNCRNYRGIRNDFHEFAQRIGACPTEKGFICFSAGKLAAIYTRKQIPVSWLCQPDIAMRGLEISVQKLCEITTGL